MVVEKDFVSGIVCFGLFFVEIFKCFLLGVFGVVLVWFDEV